MYKFETAVVSEPSVFEQLKIYCSLILALILLDKGKARRSKIENKE